MVFCPMRRLLSEEHLWVEGSWLALWAGIACPLDRHGLPFGWAWLAPGSLVPACCQEAVGGNLPAAQEGLPVVQLLQIEDGSSLALQETNLVMCKTLFFSFIHPLFVIILGLILRSCKRWVVV